MKTVHGDNRQDRDRQIEKEREIRNSSVSFSWSLSGHIWIAKPARASASSMFALFIITYVYYNGFRSSAFFGSYGAEIKSFFWWYKQHTVSMRHEEMYLLSHTTCLFSRYGSGNISTFCPFSQYLAGTYRGFACSLDAFQEHIHRLWEDKRLRKHIWKREYISHLIAWFSTASFIIRITF